MREGVLPNFLIVGGARCGTTSLYHWLHQHPDVFLPSVKEPTYFVHGYDLFDWDQYRSLFRAAQGRRAVGEASIAYLVAPESASWIRRELGVVKIIVLLRHPVQRAVSLYSWMAQEGYEWLQPFERALAEEDRRYGDDTFRKRCLEYFWSYMYFRSGLYYEQVKRYLDTFGSDSVRVYLFEALTQSPLDVYRDVCRFLGVSDTFLPLFTRQNPSRIPRSIRLQCLLRHIHETAQSFPGPGRRPLRGLATAAMNANLRAAGAWPLSASLRQNLVARYREDIVKLGHLLGRDLSTWLR